MFTLIGKNRKFCPLLSQNALLSNFVISWNHLFSEVNSVYGER